MPTDPQRRILQSSARFKIACWGRQSGKTTFGNLYIYLKARQGRSEGIYWYVLQDFAAAKRAFLRLKRVLRASGEIASSSLVELRITLKNGAEIYYMSGFAWQDMRGETLDGVVIDEMRQQDLRVWTQVTAPMLGKRDGWAVILSTPNGFDHFYDLFEAAKLDREWDWFFAPSTAAWWWSPKQVAFIKGTMSEREFRQEILAEFLDLTKGKAYVSYGQHNQRSDSPFAGGYPFSMILPMILGADFNLEPMHWNLGQHHAGRIHWHDEIHCIGPYDRGATETAATKLVEYIQDLPYDLSKAGGLIICGDATGNADQRTSNLSDYDVMLAALKKAQIRFTNLVGKINPPIKTRVNTMNTRCLAANGAINMTLDPKRVPFLHKDLQRTTWKESSDLMLDPGPKRENTHASDGAGYAVCELLPLPSIKSVGTLKVIQR